MIDNLRGMAVFAQVIEHGSFSATAKALGITTSAVSQQIRSLENDLGVALLNRSTRKLSLTHAGQVLFQSSREIVRMGHMGLDKVQALKGTGLSQLTVFVCSELSCVVTQALQRWLMLESELSVELVVTEEAPDSLTPSMIYVGVASSRSRLPSGAKLLGQINMGLWAAPSINQQYGTSLDKKLKLMPVHVPSIYKELGVYKQLSGSKQLGAKSQLGAKEEPSTSSTPKETVKLNLSTQLTTNSAQSAKQLALSGAGAALLAEHETALERSQGLLEPVHEALQIKPLLGFVLSDPSTNEQLHVGLELIHSMFQRQLTQPAPNTKKKSA